MRSSKYRKKNVWLCRTTNYLHNNKGVYVDGASKVTLVVALVVAGRGEKAVMTRTSMLQPDVEELVNARRSGQCRLE